ncbi:MAG TPA: hypothetical protein VFW26_10605, partial [Gaiellales bacterium]|nr:hypothetical protein [Gaiellales bacterium]
FRAVRVTPGRNAAALITSRPSQAPRHIRATFVTAALATPVPGAGVAPRIHGLSAVQARVPGEARNAPV